MDPIWAVLSNVRAFRDGGPPQGEYGFINVVATASTAIEAEGKARTVLEQYGWTLYAVEEVWEVDPDHLYDDQFFNEIVEDVMANPHSILLSTLHTYKAD